MVSAFVLFDECFCSSEDVREAHVTNEDFKSLRDALLFPSSFRSCRVEKRTCSNASAVPYLAYPRHESLLEVLQALPQRIQRRADVLGRVWCDLLARERCWFLLHWKRDPALQPFSLVRTPGFGGSALESTGPIDPSRNVLEGHEGKPRGTGRLRLRLSVRAGTRLQHPPPTRSRLWRFSHSAAVSLTTQYAVSDRGQCRSLLGNPS